MVTTKSLLTGRGGQAGPRIGALIVDDEPLARRGIIARLSRHRDIEVRAECGNAREAATAIRALHPEMMFLDVEMPGLSGLELVTLLPPDEMPLVVLVTAHHDYALEAFDLPAVDYLLKPIDDARFDRAVERVRERLAQRRGGAAAVVDDTARLTVLHDGRMVVLALHELTWLAADGDHLRVHARGSSWRMRGTLTGVLSRLPATQFRRIHRSTIVNLSWIRELVPQANREHQVILRDGTTLRQSRSYQDSLVDLLPPR